jgi:hypothetical protein
MTYKDDSSAPPGSTLVGLALTALCVVGLASAFSGIMALGQPKPDYAGGGLLLIASALSFGQLLNGLIRK